MAILDGARGLKVVGCCGGAGGLVDLAHERSQGMACLGGLGQKRKREDGVETHLWCAVYLVGSEFRRYEVRPWVRRMSWRRSDGIVEVRSERTRREAR